MWCWVPIPVQYLHGILREEAGHVFLQYSDYVVTGILIGLECLPQLIQLVCDVVWKFWQDIPIWPGQPYTGYISFNSEISKECRLITLELTKTLIIWAKSGESFIRYHLRYITKSKNLTLLFTRWLVFNMVAWWEIKRFTRFNFSTVNLKIFLRINDKTFIQ